MAKIIAVTVVVVSFILGIFILASAYVTATASCRQLEQDLELLGEVADRFDNTNVPQPEALRQVRVMFFFSLDKKLLVWQPCIKQ